MGEKMKIATYNVWNSVNGMPYRKNHIVNEMKKVNADVWCLQGVCSLGFFFVCRQGNRRGESSSSLEQ